MSTTIENPKSRGRSHVAMPKHGAAVDKIKKFGWTLVDQPGEFRLIHKDDLEVDPSYQRDESDAKVRAIAAAWSWLALGTILVALRDSARLFVYDGNHRVQAARLRSDIGLLPCMVFPTESAKEEAQAFLRANVNRRPMTMIERFRAMLEIADPHAMAVQELVESQGLVIARVGGPGTIECVGALMEFMKSDPDSLRRIWPLVVEVSRGWRVHERVVSAIAFAESRLHPQGISLSRSPWRERVLRLGHDGILDAAAEASRFYQTGGAKVWASGLVQRLNYGVRNRISLDPAE